MLHAKGKGIMFSPKTQRMATFRTEFASHRDFCEVLEIDTKHLYLLAFLLTANHRQAQECFLSTVEMAFKEQSVFKEWVRSWVKRNLITNAIRIASPISSRTQSRDVWNAGQPTTTVAEAIDAVTTLAPLDRFIFIMSVVERHSNWDCALLLGCSMKTVAQSRMRALRRLPKLGFPFPAGADRSRPHQALAPSCE